LPFCKGKNAYTFLYGEEDRIKMLLVRKNGALQETSWKEALNLVSSKLKEAILENFGFIASYRNSNEADFHN